MLITSHLLATLLVGKALSLNAPEVYTSLAAGVGVDIDHLFVNKKWAKDVTDFIKYRKVTYGINQHSLAQELIFGMMLSVVAGLLLHALSPLIRWWIAPLFLLIHIGMDAVMKNEHQPFAPFNKFKYFGWLRSGTVGEVLISCVGLLVLIYQW